MNNVHAMLCLKCVCVFDDVFIMCVCDVVCMMFLYDVSVCCYVYDVVCMICM